MFTCCRRVRARKPLFTSNAGTFTTDPLTANSFIEASDTHQQQLEASNKCVKILGLRKEFTTGCVGKEVKVAVDGADMTFYEGSINILLGHNGAGTVMAVCACYASAGCLCVHVCACVRACRCVGA